MSLELLQGFTGNGKSYLAMVRVLDHLLQGGVAGLNFRLTEDWAYIAAMQDRRVRKGEMPVGECAESMYRRCRYIGQPSTLDDLVRNFVQYCEGPAARRRERKVLVVLDEAQLYFNSRNWRENFPWLQLFTQHRKMGLDCLLLAHHISMIDNQVQNLISHLSRAVNLYEQLRIPGTNIRWPYPTFVYVSKSRLGGRPSFRVCLYHRRIAEMYDSFEIFGFDALSGVVESQGVLGNSCRSYCKPRFRRPWPVSPPVPESARTWFDASLPPSPPLFPRRTAVHPLSGGETAEACAGPGGRYAVLRAAFRHFLR